MMAPTGSAAAPFVVEDCVEEVAVDSEVEELVSSSV